MAKNQITAVQLKPYLIECGYRPSLIDPGTALLGGRHAAWTAFAHVPLDMRSACISAIDGLTDSQNDAAACKDLGAPITFVCFQDRFEWWKQSSGEPIWLETIPAQRASQFFQKYKEVFAPDAIYRAKTWGRVDTHHQLTFVDLGLMPLVEEEAGKRIEQLLARNVSELKKHLDWSDITQQQGKWLLQSVFWLLAAKVLRDKNVPKFKNADLADVPAIFDLVADHYGTKERLVPQGPKERSGLVAIASDIQQFADLGMLTTEALAYVYEQALIGKETRAKLGTHSTPTFLIDYILGNLAPWIKEIPLSEHFVHRTISSKKAFREVISL
ncbi:MAG TPA: hypothetical protein VH280_20780 [Verrucomicrobiae bacterium]|jgi:hypothetical protein|nr:hypothetical protein [Verrucomicrobiae bacterium]